MRPHAIDRFTDSPRVRGIYAAIVEAFPDATFAPLWRVIEGDRVAIGGITRATHLGLWRDVPATGRPIEVLGTVMLELSDGAIVDLMVVSDSLAIAEQLGGVVGGLGPRPASASPVVPSREDGAAHLATGSISCGYFGHDLAGAPDARVGDRVVHRHRGLDRPARAER